MTQLYGIKSSKQNCPFGYMSETPTEIVFHSLQYPTVKQPREATCN